MPIEAANAELASTAHIQIARSAWNYNLLFLCRSLDSIAEGLPADFIFSLLMKSSGKLFELWRVEYWSRKSPLVFRRRSV
jgi:hypothetical protein